jgi:hypothetical protein
VLVRSLFTAKGKFLVENSADAIKKLLDDRATGISQLQLRLGFLELAKASMDDFVPLVLPDGISVFGGRLLSDVLSHRDLFERFLPEFQKLLSRASSPFHILRALPALLRADPGCAHFADLFCDAVLWIGHGFELRSGAQEIADFLGSLWERVPLLANGAVAINFSDLSGLSNSLRSVASECIKCDPRRLSAMAKTLSNFLTTGTPATVFVTGLFFLHLTDRFSLYKDADSTALIRSLFAPIRTAFAVRSTDYGRFLALTIGASHAEGLLPPEDLAAIWRAVLANLTERSPREFGRPEVTALAERLTRAVPREAVAEAAAELLGAIRVTFAAVPIGAVHGALLDAYTAVRADVDDFADPEQPLSFVTIAAVIAGAGEAAAAARETIARIESAASGVSIVRAVAEKVDGGTLVRAALEIVAAQVEVVDDAWVRIVGDLHDVLADDAGKEAVEFRKRLVSRVVSLALSSKGKDSEALGELLRRIYQ